MDAKATEWFSQNFSTKELLEKYGVQCAFISTHSGLLQWKSFSSDSNDGFADENNQAIDEIWYRRSVKHNFINPEAFVYSVPFDAYKNNESLVTVSHAIYHKDGTKSAPVAVVGLQFQYSALFKLFNAIPTNNKYKTYVLDYNAFVIVSNDSADAGKFFGSVESGIMHRLVVERVFKKISIFDYQAICYPLRFPDYIAKYQMVNIGKALITPFQMVWKSLETFLFTIASILIGYSEPAGAYEIQHCE